MYYLMNKDKTVALLDVSQSFSPSKNGRFRVIEQYDKMPIGCEGIDAWIDGRKSSKYNAHLKAVMNQMGCNTNEGFAQVTHAATINDTFWIKSDKENVTWNQVSLYRNEFSKSVSKLVFEGIGLCETVLSLTSPELTSEGSFRKCFRKENAVGEFSSDIFIYKRGYVMQGDMALGLGNEPYCEMMSSEIAKIISPNNSVRYDLTEFHGSLASRCNLFTNEQYGYAPFSRAYNMKTYTLDDAFDFYCSIDSEQEFREMLVIDSLCFNQDRHAGNFGVIFNNDTLQIEKIAPVFDLNKSLLAYVEDSEFKCIGDKLYNYIPKLGDDFVSLGQAAMNDRIRDRVKDLKDFTFSFQGDDHFSKKRVQAIENIVRTQAKAILSKENLIITDVFYSQKAVKEQEFAKKIPIFSRMFTSSF